MSVDGYGMTPEGFRTKRKETIINEIFDELESNWGPVKRNPESTLGQLVSILSKPAVRGWLELEANYMSDDPDSADDIHLDNLSKYTNVERKKATGTSVICAIYGTNGTVVPENSIVSDDYGNLYSSVDDYTITNLSLVHAEISLDDYENVIERSIRITSSGYDATFTETSSGDNWKVNFISWLDLQITDGLLPAGLTAETTDDGLNIVSVGYVSFQVYSTTNITTEKTGSPFIVVNTITGAIPAVKGSVINIVTSVSGFDEVYNWSNGVIGSDIEDNVTLRIRRRRSKYQGGANIDAIANAIENNVEGIRTVKVYENDEDIVIDSLKPHSIYAVVDGAEGKDQEIADIIWEKKGNGIKTNGNISVNVVDRNGDVVVVLFDRATPTYGWVDVEVTEVETGKSLPSDWETQIRDNISYLINSMAIGDDFSANKMGSGVYAVDSLLDANIQVGTSTSPEIEPTNWVSSSISISKYVKVMLGSYENIIISGG